MHRNTKIATCNFCGTRAALVLDAAHHELICRSCGAQLHNLKSMPMERGTPAYGITHPTGMSPSGGKPKKANKPKKKKKSTARWFLSEAVDLLEDIFD